MFNIGPEKLVLLLFIALVVLGPKRLPDAAHALGRAVAEMRRVSGHIQEEVHGALADPKDALTAAVGDLRRELGDLGSGGFLGSVMSPPADGGSSAGASASVSDAARSGSASTTSSAPAPAPSLSSTPLPPSPDDPSLN